MGTVLCAFASFLVTAVYIIGSYSKCWPRFKWKVCNSYVPSDAHLTSHRVSKWTTVTASVAMDRCHSGTAKTTLCWNLFEPRTLHRDGAVADFTGTVFLHRRRADPALAGPSDTIGYLGNYSWDSFMKRWRKWATELLLDCTGGMRDAELATHQLRTVLGAQSALNEAVLRCLRAAALCYHLKSAAVLAAEKMFPASLRSPHLVVLTARKNGFRSLLSKRVWGGT